MDRIARNDRPKEGVRILSARSRFGHLRQRGGLRGSGLGYEVIGILKIAKSPAYSLRLMRVNRAQTTVHHADGNMASTEGSDAGIEQLEVHHRILYHRQWADVRSLVGPVVS